MEEKKAKVIKMVRLELTFMSGKFTAYPGVIKDSVTFSEGNKSLTFKATGTARDFDDASEVMVNIDNICFIESIPEEDYLLVVED